MQLRQAKRSLAMKDHQHSRKTVEIVLDALDENETPYLNLDQDDFLELYDTSFLECLFGGEFN